MSLRELLEKAFTDAQGFISYGRLASFVCLIAAIDCFACGMIYTEFQTYCTTMANSFMLQSVGFYTVSKGQQALSSFGKGTQDAG